MISDDLVLDSQGNREYHTWSGLPDIDEKYGNRWRLDGACAYDIDNPVSCVFDSKFQPGAYDSYKDIYGFPHSADTISIPVVKEFYEPNYDAAIGLDVGILETGVGDRYTVGYGVLSNNKDGSIKRSKPYPKESVSMDHEKLTGEIIRKIDPHVDFSQFDLNDDGIVDYMFVVLRDDPYGRKDKLDVYSGISRIDQSIISISDNACVASSDGQCIKVGSYIVHNRPGNVIPAIYHTSIWAHEIGYDLWRSHFGHLEAIENNDVPIPFDTTRVLASKAPVTERVGYALMPGDGGAYDMAGSQTISAYERSLIGWIDCSSLTADTTGVVLSDLYTNGDCHTIDLDNGSAGKTIYLSNQQRISYFDNVHRFVDPVTHFTAYVGLMDTGIVVGLAENSTKRYDELPADNTLDKYTYEFTYEGDLRTPTTGVQLTPWTRPNINGYTEYPRTSGGFEPSWQAIDGIRSAGGTDLQFDYIRDFRLRPILREDSWIGMESSGIILREDLIVQEGVTLSIQEGVTLKFAPGKGIVVRGTLVIAGSSSHRVVLTASSQDSTWSGIRFMGRGSSGNIRYADSIHDPEQQRGCRACPRPLLA